VTGTAEKQFRNANNFLGSAGHVVPVSYRLTTRFPSVASYAAIMMRNVVVASATEWSGSKPCSMASTKCAISAKN
jgi:hypothetical protein